MHLLSPQTVRKRPLAWERTSASTDIRSEQRGVKSRGIHNTMERNVFDKSLMHRDPVNFAQMESTPS